MCLFIPENVIRWERTVQDGEDELETGRQAEMKQRADIDRELRRVEDLKAERTAAKARADDAEEDLTKVWLSQGHMHTIYYKLRLSIVRQVYQHRHSQ